MPSLSYNEEKSIFYPHFLLKNGKKKLKNIKIYLNLGLHVLNGVGWLDLEGDGLPGEGLDEDLHGATFFVL